MSGEDLTNEISELIKGTNTHLVSDVSAGVIVRQ